MGAVPGSAALHFGQDDLSQIHAMNSIACQVRASKKLTCYISQDE
jgi:hypothetical protein